MAPIVQIAGDLTVDWLSYDTAAGSAIAYGYQWDGENEVGLSAQAGGAALLTELLQMAGADSYQVAGIRLTPDEASDPHAATVTRTYSRWTAVPAENGSKERAWRMAEFVGVTPASSPREERPDEDTSPACLAIDDANLGFRDDPDRWPTCLMDAPPASVIVKVTNPLCRGAFWDQVLAHHSHRLTILVALNDLRREGAAIGETLSWERLAQDIARAVRADPRLSRAARVIVTSGVTGAVVVERAGDARLVFDPHRHEGEWLLAHPGQIMGLGMCQLGALADAAIRCSGEPDWLTAVQAGLAAGRRLWGDGFHFVSGQGLAFPTGIVGGGSTAGLATVLIDEHDESWTILAGRRLSDNLDRVAEEVVRRGPDSALPGVPVERFGQWSSVDRAEIETMRSIRLIVEEYLAQARAARPLSLAVFGAPGSGKSFGVKQLAQDWSAGRVKVAIIEFNLSQFAGPAELAPAFHQVRDAMINGSLPLVFWDEFDATLDGQPMGWLKTVLAPMQDGAFSDDGRIRPIGPAIFVFAGGIHRTMDSFKSAAAGDPATKATDFLSRLRGYVDILGANPSGPDDRHVALRRAFLLRSVLQRRAPQLFRRGTLAIDDGVLRAFLQVPEYLHGARSLEAIVDMSTLAGRLRYERSSLPPQHQLNLHTTATSFLDLVRREG